MALILLSSQAAIADNAAIADAPSSLLSKRAVLNTTGAPHAYLPAPRVPEQSAVIDRQFLMLSVMSTSAIFMDSYTTTWIGNNYRNRGPGPCTVEGGEPRLYGLHPTVARSYAIGAGMSGGAITVSYLAKKYLPPRLKWMWPSAFIYETGISIHGFSTNLGRC